MGKLRLGICCAAHFWVDLACAALLLGRICPAADPAMALLLYNGFAFAAQMPLGVVADRLDRSHWVAAAGCLVTLGAWLLPGGMVAAAVAGLGNAAFHVGGGLDVINHSGGRAGPLGLFVSPGAVGLWLGGALSGAAARLALPVCAGLALAAVAFVWLRRGIGNEQGVPLGQGSGLLPALLCLLAVVVLRSWLGLSAALPWKAGLGVWAVVAVAAGKAAGGYLADRLGASRVAVGSLTLAAAGIWIGGAVPGALGLALFNMTMPLSLWAAARLLPGRRGFAFGLLTFGLFLGYLPGALGAGAVTPWGMALGALAGLPPLLLGLRRGRAVAR